MARGSQPITINIPDIERDIIVTIECVVQARTKGASCAADELIPADIGLQDDLAAAFSLDVGLVSKCKTYGELVLLCKRTLALALAEYLPKPERFAVPGRRLFTDAEVRKAIDFLRGYSHAAAEVVHGACFPGEVPAKAMGQMTVDKALAKLDEFDKTGQRARMLAVHIEQVKASKK